MFLWRGDQTSQWKGTKLLNAYRICVHTYSFTQVLKAVVALNPRMAKMGMEAYRDVALFITPTKTASLSQLFLIETHKQVW